MAVGAIEDDEEKLFDFQVGVNVKGNDADADDDDDDVDDVPKLLEVRTAVLLDLVVQTECSNDALFYKMWL